MSLKTFPFSNKSFEEFKSDAKFFESMKPSNKLAWRKENEKLVPKKSKALFSKAKNESYSVLAFQWAQQASLYAIDLKDVERVFENFSIFYQNRSKKQGDIDDRISKNFQKAIKSINCTRPKNSLIQQVIDILNS